MKTHIRNLRTLLILPIVAIAVTQSALGQIGTWTTKSPMPTPRSHRADGEANGIIYAVGGLAARPNGSIDSRTNVVEAYNPATDTWAPKASMPTPRLDLVVGNINGILYFVGGNATAGGGALATVEAYDPLSNTWTTKASMPTARFGSGAGVINGILYVAGGQTATGDTAALEAYDPVTNTWTTKA